MSHDLFDVSALEREPVPAAGVLLEQDRGTLPFALIHGESLVATAAWAAGEAGVELVDATLGWDVVVDRDEPMVLLDPLCPMTPPHFIAQCVRDAVDSGTVVVGVRPVTDTVKQVDEGTVGATVDRDALAAVCSPIVLPPAVLADVVARGGVDSTDFVRIVDGLRDAGVPVRFLEAPAQARRIGSEEDLQVLEALTTPN